MDVRIIGRIRSGSNAVFLAEEVVPGADPTPESEHEASSGGAERSTRLWVHKPVRGESPLHDFPAGILPPAAAVPGSSVEAQLTGTLAAREIAAYRLARTAGWDVVPETLPIVSAAGPGMIQRFLDIPQDDADENDAPVDLYAPENVPSDVRGIIALDTEDGDTLVLGHRTSSRIRTIALLDAVINNSDRKGGHVLRDSDGTIWAIDHGLAFHTDPKVRSVLWGFADESLDDVERAQLHALRGACATGDLRADLAELLAPEEIDALVERIDALLASGTFPPPAGGFPLPWPLF